MTALVPLAVETTADVGSLVLVLAAASAGAILSRLHRRLVLPTVVLEILLGIVIGPEGLGWEGPDFDEDELKITRDWLRSRGNSIEGGTSEVQLNIIAKRVLGLPD